ncbi:MAG: hypothetical protein LUE10_08880, partial [Alistipes sp.]|nr:hypothetical protein [Alistipes sp.]
CGTDSGPAVSFPDGQPFYFYRSRNMPYPCRGGRLVPVEGHKMGRREFVSVEFFTVGTGLFLHENYTSDGKCLQ